MAEEAQQRVENALSKFVDDIDRSHLRSMQDEDDDHRTVQRSSRQSNPMGFKGGQPLSASSSLTTAKSEGQGRMVQVDGYDVQTFVESNTVESVARFYVYVTHLQSFRSSGAGSSSGSFPALKALMHWGVIVEFECFNSVYTFDVDNVDGSLSGGPFVVKVRTCYPGSTKIRSKTEVGNPVSISPAELIRRARDFLPRTGCYNFIFNNCQSWAHKFCKEIAQAKKPHLTIGDVLSISSGIVVGVAAGFALLFDLRADRAVKETAEEGSEDGDSDDEST